MMLLDTHIWIKWIVENGETLSSSMLDQLVQSEQVAVSAISCFEIAWLVRNNRLELPLPVETWIEQALEPAGIECLPISCVIARKSVELPLHHKDPADRIIIATALHHQAFVASHDRLFPLYQELSGRLIR